MAGWRALGVKSSMDHVHVNRIGNRIAGIHMPAIRRPSGRGARFNTPSRYMYIYGVPNARDLNGSCKPFGRLENKGCVRDLNYESLIFHFHEASEF